MNRVLEDTVTVVRKFVFENMNKIDDIEERISVSLAWTYIESTIISFETQKEPIDLDEEQLHYVVFAVMYYYEKVVLNNPHYLPKDKETAEIIKNKWKNLIKYLKKRRNQ